VALAVGLSVPATARAQDTADRAAEPVQETAAAEAPSPLEAQPYFVALSVADAEASAAWYERVFGFRTERSMDLAERGVRIRLLRGPAGLLELVEDREARALADLEPPIERRFRLHGVFKVGFQVTDLDATVDRLEALGVELRGQVFTESDGSMRSLQVEDPDGNVLQLFELVDD